MSNSSLLPIDRILSGATITGQSGPGSDGNERVLRIPQNSSIPEVSPSDYLVSYFNIVEIYFEFLLRNYVHFRTDTLGKRYKKPFPLPIMC